MATYQGRRLTEQIDRLAVPHGMLALWALGQVGMVIKGGQTIVYIDPYLSHYGGRDERGHVMDSGRAIHPPLHADEVTNAQVVFCTHEHLDHTDPMTVGPLAQASPQARFVGPANSADILREAGIADERILTPTVDHLTTWGDLTFTAIPSAHYGLDYDPQRGYRFLGYILELNGVTLYHAGDTILYDGLLDRLTDRAIDIACLPINGRDWFREQQNIIGNLNADEAAALADAIGADVFIPTHNDMFAGNHVNPALLADTLDRRYPRQKYHWLQPGELYIYVK